VVIMPEIWSEKTEAGYQEMRRTALEKTEDPGKGKERSFGTCSEGSSFNPW